MNKFTDDFREKMVISDAPHPVQNDGDFFNVYVGGVVMGRGTPGVPASPDEVFTRYVTQHPPGQQYCWKNTAA
jgi:hypothetical protein